MNNNRKRARLETATAATAGDIVVKAAKRFGGITARAATTSTAVLPMHNNMSGQSIFLTRSNCGDVSNNRLSCSAVSNSLPANVFLTICDETSDEDEQEYLLDGSALTAHIKEEQDAATQTHSTLPLQYRIVNHLQPPQLQLQLEADTSSSPVELNSQAAASALLPAAMQLPSGCEIYLVKEYVDADSGSSELFVNSNVAATSSGAISSTSALPTTAAIKLESGARLTNVASAAARQVPVSALLSPQPCASQAQTAAGSTATPIRHNIVLDTYKKRDDKRRATHNEVERRRRDKINSWIFKLKEMLPTDVPPSSSSSNNTNNIATTNATILTASASNCAAAESEPQPQQRYISSANNNNNRSPPSDSKSQILIKACEYIKAMQDEIKSLRECLTENENLRLCNHRLQNELNELKNERRHDCIAGNNNTLSNTNNHTSNNSQSSTFNLTLNRINSTDFFGATSATPTAAKTLGLLTASNDSVVGNMINNLSPTTYTKRELIITDYVD